MNSLKKLAALIAAGALLLAMMLVSTGAAAAGEANVAWEGNGATDGVLNTEQCDGENTPYLYWVFHPGGNATVSDVTLHLGGTGSGDFPMTQSAEDNDNGAFKATTPYYTPDPSELEAWVTWASGELGTGNPGLVISHGCAGTEESAPPSEAPSFEASQAGETDVASEPNTATFGTNGTSGPADGAWLLVVALGVLLASIVVLTPARAKSRR